ncbi:MAG: AzlC family ABC transporter permease [Ectothiorhodospiraceae bacterium]|nr:AzlC family ABC transporter permease [Ectothiorhodospiraceae bacterium]MCH8504850.1 AzlC family ABC transporter permease [Ectothiorhodospiraceae bacterium]
MQQTISTWKAAVQGMQASSPVAVAYLGIGLAAGVVGAEAGLSPAEVGLLSLLLFAGSAQFVFADLYTGAFTVLVSTVFLVNLRHLLYSTALSPRVRHHSPGARFLIGAQLTDETFALASGLMGSRLRYAAWMIGLNVASYLAWCTGNVTGAVLGSMAGAIDALGLEFALAGMFAALLVGQIRSRLESRHVGIIVAVLAATLMVMLDYWRPHALNLVLTTVTAATVGLILGMQRNDSTRDETA